MRIAILMVIVLFAACSPKEEVGSIEKLHPALDELLSSDTKVEVLAEGFQWSEGPLWVDSCQMVLFSDVPKNIIHKWTEEKGLETYLTPSGFTIQEEGNAGEGANGLLLNAKGELVLCQHGDRRMAVMQTSITNPSADFVSLADTYEGKRLSSPNDAVYSKNGDLFFTDPPYGLQGQDEDPAKELPFNGVYKLSSTGELTLLIDSLTRPNGIILLNDDKTLLVANSDKDKARWYAYDLPENDSIASGRVFYDATKEASKEVGLPDGMKVTKQGIVFATGPGGVWIFDQTGMVLGKIKTNTPSANCALAKNDTELYITSERYLLRVRLK
jgi:gluconolactonase